MLTVDIVTNRKPYGSFQLTATQEDVNRWLAVKIVNHVEDGYQLVIPFSAIDHMEVRSA